MAYMHFRSTTQGQDLHVNPLMHKKPQILNIYIEDALVTLLASLSG